jgi:hypothetical protein
MKKEKYLPRGLRNNNPGNIRIGEEAFLGEIKPSQDKSFRQFEHIKYGYRALFRQMYLYLTRGIDTIEEIINAWAPPSENNTSSYVSAVCRETGIKRDKKLTARDGENYIKIVAAISHVENGVEANMGDAIAGFELQNDITK